MRRLVPLRCRRVASRMDAASAPADDRVRLALGQALGLEGSGAPLELRRTPAEQRSTFALERLDVLLPDGARLQLAFKRLQWSEPEDASALSKPKFVFDARREPAVYSTLLPIAPEGPPRYFGSVATEDDAGRWLFVEWVNGRELHQVGELAIWTRVASWLGRLHCALAADVPRHLREGRLLRHDGPHCMRWARRAQSFARAAEGENARTRNLDLIVARYDAVLHALAQMPRTVIHGDFYASNVLVAQEGGAIRVAPVDWEMAGAAPGLMDLAALVSGGWSPAARETMIAAYAEAASGLEFCSRQLDFARLHHAVQRLGWVPPGWEPPASQRHDWLGEAIELAERLSL